MMTATNYLRKIYQITEAGEESTTTSELAKQTKVTNASASEAVAKLEEEHLVCRAPYKGFTLSPMGKEKGKKLADKHEKLKTFFEKIGLEEPSEEARKIETEISKEAVRKIDGEIL
jgi:Mn-dependent DtxR family transcriptional regulator